MTKPVIFGYEEPLDPEQLAELTKVLQEHVFIRAEDAGSGKVALVLAHNAKVVFEVQGWSHDAWVGWEIEDARSQD